MKNYIYIFSFVGILFCSTLHSEEKISEADKKIIVEYACYEKDGKAQADCYEKMYDENRNMKNWHSKRYYKKQNGELKKEMHRKKSLEEECLKKGEVYYGKKCISKKEYAKTYSYFTKELAKSGCNILKAETTPGEDGKLAVLDEKVRRQRVKQNCEFQSFSKSLSSGKAREKNQEKINIFNKKIIADIESRGCLDTLVAIKSFNKENPKIDINSAQFMKLCNQELQKINDAKKSEIKSVPLEESNLDDVPDGGVREERDAGLPGGLSK